ncbi:MAG: SprB repeat-containing protein, partial [Flavobacterium sp.]|uniref:SprB repeat-containing protein n=1 Tax=Flavobacterium sp. TaxID=239 RepID=UPI002639FCB1
MKNIYFKTINYKLQYLVLLIAIFIGNMYTAEAQVKKSFTQRTSQYTPTKKIYNVKGDFTMLGNTNLTPQNYSPTTNNNGQNMQYVDIDGDSNTWNSSSSTLAFSTENGASPECSKIIYAGLYWTGKSSASNTFTETKNIPTGNNISVPATLSNARIYNSTSTIVHTNYTLTITSSGSNNNKIITYNFASSVSGNPNVKFIYNYNNGNETLFKSINGGAETSVSTSSIDDKDAYLNTSYVIFSDSNYTLTLNRLRRNGKNSDSASPTSAYVDISYIDIVPETIQISKTFDKRKISLKGPLSSTYTTFTANATDIYYPSGSDDNIYSAYIEITDYVKANKVGEYFAADIALLEGNPGGTGYSGGWGMIVVYENAKMKYRDVTIFDGYAYVQASNNSAIALPVSGFNTVQSGDVGVKLGLMASEGDVSFTGDYFKIQKLNTSNYLDLSHSGNSTTNFFNSSIETGGSYRNPNLVNNTGIDISMFNVPNSDKSVIGNNQTSTNFQYGTSGDTYSIFAIAMSVDAYIPVVDAVVSPVSVNNIPVNSNSITTQPGDIIDLKVDIKNNGTEAVNNTKFVIPIPYTADYVNASLVKNVYFLPLPSPNNYYFDPSLGPKGSIVYDLGTLPLPANPNDVLATLSFKIKITEDCSILKNSLCNQNTSISGLISGSGVITGVNFSNKPFFIGYSSDGGCVGDPILNPLLIGINSASYVTNNCADTPNSREFVFCTSNQTIPITDISDGFPPGSLFYDEYPVTNTSIQYTISNPFPVTESSINYYAIPPGADDGCYFPFKIKVTNVITMPDTTPSIEYCQGSTALPLTATATNPSYTLYYFTSLNGTAQLSITPSTTTIGQTTYYVAEAASGSCIGPKKAIVVTVNGNPSVSLQNKTDVLCYGASTGSIDINTTGGVAPYTYVWTKDGNPYGALTEDLTNIESGVYVVTVSDSKSCMSVQLSTTITQPAAALSATVTSQTNVSCFGDASGSAVITPAGGTAPYLITPAQTGLSAGLQTFTITDNNGCSTTVDATIIDGDNTPPTISQLPDVTTIDCPATPLFTQASATDNIDPSPIVTFNDVTTPGNCAGSYSVTRTWTFTDACGNTSSTTQTINVIDDVAPLAPENPATLNVACASEVPAMTSLTATDNCNGDITVEGVD